MATRTITGKLIKADGSNWSDADIVFDLKTLAATTATELVHAKRVVASSDSVGAFSTTLSVPSSGSWYWRCTRPDGQYFEFWLESGNQINISSILLALNEGGSTESQDALLEILAAHTSLSANVHGIADTSVLATDSDVTAAQAAAAAALTAHSSVSTSIHGIADTSVLATDSDVTAAQAAAAATAAFALVTHKSSGDHDLRMLPAWAESGAYEATNINRDSDGVVTTATVKWLDGSSGVFTTTSKNSTWIAIDAYTITHVGLSVTVTQSAVTRDSDGAVTVKPAIVVG